MRRSAGAAPSKVSIASRKPMSSISSASSSTSVATLLSFRLLRSMRSTRRPGVPTATSTPRASTFASPRKSVPPVKAATRAPAPANNQASSRCTCAASSRVGVMMSARGADAGETRGSSSAPTPSSRPRRLAAQVQRELAWLFAGAGVMMSAWKPGRRRDTRLVAGLPLRPITSPKATVLPEPVCADTSRSRGGASSTAVRTGVLAVS